MNIEKSSLKIDTSFFNDLKHLIEGSKKRVYQVVNNEITILYCDIGKRINQDILNNNRVDYGKQILPTLSGKL